MANAVIGQRVKLCHLLHEGEFDGTIIDIDFITGWCVVKLDCQDEPVAGTVYYEKPPKIIESTQWQVCWPIERINNG